MSKKSAKLFVMMLCLLSPYTVAVTSLVLLEAIASPDVSPVKPLVFVDPEFTELSVGDTFMVSVKVFNLTDNYVKDPVDPKVMRPLGNLYGFDIRFAWDSAILAYDSHVVHVPVETYYDGVLYEPVMSVKDEVSSAQGTFTAVYTSTSPAGVFNIPDQEAIIFEMAFRVIRRGACYLRLTSVTLSTNKLGEAILFDSRDARFQTPGVPVARFTTWPPDGYTTVNQPMTFNGSESTATAPRYLIRYIWDFGDNTKENTTTPLIDHVYPNKGQFKASLRVMDDEEVISAPVEKTIVVIEKRDVAVRSITVSRDIVLWGKTLDINVTVSNNGGATENFTITVYYNSTPTGGWTPIEQKQIVNLRSGFDDTEIFSWNTSTVPETIAYYNVSASLSPVPQETNTADNSRAISSLVLVTTEVFEDIAIGYTSPCTCIASVLVSNIHAPTPFIVGENITMRFTARARGTAEETQYSVTAKITAEPSGTVVSTFKRESESLQSGKSKDFSFYTKDLAAGNYTIRVNATTVGVDNDLSNNLMDEAIKVISPPVPKVADLPETIYVGDTISFNATGSYHTHPGGQITDFRWEFSEPETGALRETKHGALVEYALDTSGNWTVTLTLTDKWFSYNPARAATNQPYRVQLIVEVVAKPGEETPGLPIEMILAAVAIVVIAVIGAVAFWRLRKRKAPSV